MAEADSTRNTTKECDGCGSLFIAKQDRQRYCNRKCQGRAKAACIACGVDFYATRNSHAKYCSVACSLEHTHAERRTRRAKERREKEDAWRERNQGKTCGVSIKPCICCELELVGPRPTKTWAGKFCVSCRNALGSSITSNPGRINLLKIKLNGRKCETCGVTFTPYTKTQTTCSTKCQKQTEQHRESVRRNRRQYRKTEAYKRQKRIENKARRARKRGNGRVDKIDPIEVFNRDRWRCYICGVYTPKRLLGKLTQPRAPVMDHVIPLYADGPHTYENVACCCNKCNTEKGHTIYQEDFFIRQMAAEP